MFDGNMGLGACVGVCVGVIISIGDVCGRAYACVAM